MGIATLAKRKLPS